MRHSGAWISYEFRIVGEGIVLDGLVDGIQGLFNKRAQNAIALVGGDLSGQPRVNIGAERGLVRPEPLLQVCAVQHFVGVFEVL